MKILGIDEAGRGPLLGPLVMAGVVIEEEDESKLISLGVKDSKLLTPKQRESMFESVKEIAKDHFILIIEPNEIDDAVNGKDNLNLNWLEAVKSVEITAKLQADKVIMDCPSINVQAYKDYIVERLGNKNALPKELIVEHKADQNYLVVSAASILAKVTRDREIEKIKQEIQQNIGSGYPSDPTTKEFLANNYYKFPKIFRHSWQSCKNIAAQKSQTKLGEFKKTDI